MSKATEHFEYSLELNTEGNKAPTEIMLIPAGQVKGRDGRIWFNSNPDRVLDAFEEYNGPVSIDYEHGNFLGGPKPTPSAGWINSIFLRDGAIWGNVKWTPKAKQMIEDEEYRFHSPVFYSDGEKVISSIVGSGLTNRPNLVMPAFNKQEKPNHTLEKEMKPEQRKVLCAVLGLDEGVSDESIVTAAGTLKNDKELALNKISSFDASKVVPIADYQQVKGDLDLALNKISDFETAGAEAAVDKAIKDRKIAPSSKDYHLNACKTQDGLEAFNKMVASSPAIIDDQNNLDGDPEKKKPELNKDQRKILEGLGIDAKDEKVLADIKDAL